MKKRDKTHRLFVLLMVASLMFSTVSTKASNKFSKVPKNSNKCVIKKKKKKKVIRRKIHILNKPDSLVYTTPVIGDTIIGTTMMIRDSIQMILKNDWEILKSAIIYTESKGKYNAKNGRCVGVLQLMPCYVTEVNKLLGYKKYSLNDRLDRQKSLEMFEIYNKYKNPQHNIIKAIRLHNPKGGTKYIKKIVTRMAKIKSTLKK
jgi:hypothetical protein